MIIHLFVCFRIFVRMSTRFGEVAERLNALVLKTSKDESPSRVRIPPSPPFLSACPGFTGGVRKLFKVDVRMIAKLVSFQLPTDMSREDVVLMAREVALEWLKHPKLLRKDFLLDENNKTYGYYVFADRESAEQAHGEDFLARLKKQFGVEPTMQYFDYLMTADVDKAQVTGE